MGANSYLFEFIMLIKCLIVISYNLSMIASAGKKKKEEEVIEFYVPAVPMVMPRYNDPALMVDWSLMENANSWNTLDPIVISDGDSHGHDKGHESKTHKEKDKDKKKEHEHHKKDKKKEHEHHEKNKKKKHQNEDEQITPIIISLQSPHVYEQGYTGHSSKNGHHGIHNEGTPFLVDDHYVHHGIHSEGTPFLVDDHYVHHGIHSEG